MVLKDDKGGTTMVMNKNAYINQMYENMFLSGCYRNVNREPLSKIIKECFLLGNDFKKKLVLICYIVPRMYGLLKIHKDNIPLRHTINTMGLQHTMSLNI